MKNLNYYVIVAFSLLALASCKKDDDVTIPDYYQPLIGSWKITDGISNAEHFIFTEDNYCYKLFQHQYDFRSIELNIVQVTKGQVLFDRSDYSVSEVFNFRITNDTLYLTRPDKKIVAVKSSTSPTVEEWIEEINFSTSFQAPVELSSDIAYDAGFIWFGNGYFSNYLYKVNLLNGSKDSIPITQYAWAVGNDNTNLWVSSNGSSNITKINKTTGAVISTSIAMGPWIYGIAWDSQYLWCFSGNENTLYKYNPAGDEIVTEILLSNDLNMNGLTYADGHLYACINGVLAKCSLAPFKALNSYKLTGYYLYGITYDGSNFWVNAYNETTQKYVILKLVF